MGRGRVRKARERGERRQQAGQGPGDTSALESKEKTVSSSSGRLWLKHWKPRRQYH